MLHEYRKKTTIKAEQFDGTDEMIEKYRLHSYGPETWVLPMDYNFIPIVKGVYIVTDEDGFHEVCYPDVFHRTYEEMSEDE